MKNNMLKKYFYIILICTFLFTLMLNSKSFAGDISQKNDEDAISTSKSISVSNVTKQAENFIDDGLNLLGDDINIRMRDAVWEIGGILMGIGTVILVVVGIVLGLQLMAANDQKRAQVKQKMIWYLVSIALVYGATGITALVINIIGIK